MTAIAGSWEELFARAVQAAKGRDPQTETLFDKLITRLNKLPERVLLAGDGYLVGIRDMAIAEYAQYLIDMDRLDASLVLVENPANVLQEIDAVGWCKLRAFVFAKVGRVDEADAQWMQMIAETNEVGDLHEAFFGLLAIKRFASAAAIVREVEGLASRMAEEADDGEYLPALLMRLTLLAAIHRPEETRKALARLLRSDDEGITFLEGILEIAWGGGFTPEEMLQLLDVREVRRSESLAANFWRAFALQRLERYEEALPLWRAIATDEVLHSVEDQPGDMWQWVIAQYYLGDPKSLGLAAALDTLREYGESAPWSAFAATAIGWARQDDLQAAHLNIVLASQSVKRSTFGDGRIASPWRLFAQDLLAPEQFAPLAAFFAEQETAESKDVAP